MKSVQYLFLDRAQRQYVSHCLNSCFTERLKHYPVSFVIVSSYRPTVHAFSVCRPQNGGEPCLGTNVRIRSCNVQVSFAA